jgi:release factor glutamine methyltransferase
VPDPVSEPRTAVQGAESGEGPWTVRRLTRWMTAHFSRRGVESPRVVADTLLANVLGCERMRLYMEPDREPSEAERERLRGLVARASRHEPLQYLVGEWPFWGSAFEVGPATLIPRPATESLVERAVGIARDDPSFVGKSLCLVDACTGTGCIAVATMLGLRRSRREGGCRPLGEAAGGAGGIAHRAIATELVPEAAELARRNIARHGLSGAIEVRDGDLLEPLATEPDASIDLLLANPPYVSDAEWDGLAPNVRDFEPATALRGGRDGLDLVRRLVAGAPRLVRPGGWMLVEIGHAQRESAPATLDRAAWDSIEVLKDHEGFWRVLVARRL